MLLAVSLALSVALNSAAAPDAGASPGGSPAAPSGVARRALDQLCVAYADAAEQVEDPDRAADHVQQHYITLWPDLLRMIAAVAAVEPALRYGLWLQFARRDYPVTGWTCAPLDRLLLRMVEKREWKAKPDRSDGPRLPLVEVSLAGVISLDGKQVPMAKLRIELARFKRPNHWVRLYREGWQKQVHPNADLVVGEMIERDLRIVVCARAGCVTPARI